MRQNETNSVATGDILRIPDCSCRSCLDFLIASVWSIAAGCCHSRIVVWLGVYKNVFAWRQHKIWAWTISWVSFSFCLGGVDFSESQHQTPHICWFSAVVCQAGATWGKEKEKKKPLLKPNMVMTHGRPQPFLTEAWIGKTKWKSTLSV